jgi:16S rRNA processing protein RimM
VSAHDLGETNSGGSESRAVPAGRVGRAHGLDGSFYVTGGRSRLLVVGTAVRFGERTAKIVRRAGTDEHPIVRLEEIESRVGVEALRGLELTVELAAAPTLEEGEWWAQELEGCDVVDGEQYVGKVVGLMELPSCEALEVRLAATEVDRATEMDRAAETETDRAAEADRETEAGRPGKSGKRGSGGELLVPMVRDAIRHVDPVGRRIDVNMAFLGEA